MRPSNEARRAVVDFLCERGVRFDRLCPKFRAIARILAAHKLIPQDGAGSKTSKQSVERFWKDRLLGHSPAPRAKPIHPDSLATFLKSRAWAELRYDALLRYGRICACCGATPYAGARLHVDHIKPRSRYPELAREARAHGMRRTSVSTRRVGRSMRNGGARWTGDSLPRCQDVWPA